MHHATQSHSRRAPAPRPFTNHHESKGAIFKQWVRDVWTDVLTLAIFGAVTLGLHHVPVAALRTFPVTFTQSGDIVFPEWGYPDRGWIIPTWLSGVLNALVPIFFILLAQIRVRSLWDMTAAVTGVLYANILGTIFSVITKKLIGGFRPYFLEICQPDISLASKPGGSTLNGSGFQKMFYTTEICTTTNHKKLESAISSFPSGHAVAAFAGFGFLFLYFNGKLKVWSNHRPQIWKLPLLFAPVLGAFLLACCLSVDAAHNWYDIVIGSLIGTTFALGSYRMSYASLWDWRYNHIPLRRHEYIYTNELSRDTVFTREAGWGWREKGSLKHPGPGVTSARSSATMPHGRRHHEVRGDEIV